MHPRNKIRLMAGVVIDPSLESKEETAKLVSEAMDGSPSPLSVSEVEPTPRASEQTATASDNFDEGDLVIYNNGVGVVVMADPKTDMIGVIPAGLINASAPEKNRAVEMIKPDSEKCRKPTREEIDAFKASEQELASVDDDMDISFQTQEGWDMEKAEKGGEKYAKKTREKREGKRQKHKINLKKNKITKESEEGEKSTLGSRIKAKRMSESTHNYAPGNLVSHEDNDRDPINAVSQDKKSWQNSLDPKTVKNEYTSQMDNKDEQSSTEENTKVKVPSNVKSDLKKAITAFKTDAEKQGNGHTGEETAQFMMDTAEAFQKLLDYLQAGTIMDIKRAQVFATSLMGPMFHKIPDTVWDFIVNGGQKRSLKDYMIKVK